MRIVIVGGTGFLGRPLASHLIADGHQVVILTRGRAESANGGPQIVTWTPDRLDESWTSAIDGASAVINLAGESIGGGRWTSSRKVRLVDSRQHTTRTIVDAIQRAHTPPPLLISGSAVGYYGPHGDEILTESDGPGSDFLASVCVRWEAEARRAESAHTRVVRIRTGIVLERDGGALPQMLPPFKLFAGGPVGSGRQYWPWIHRADWINLVRWLLRQPDLSGAVNVTAPEPVTNADFARALGRAMHRPSSMPTPGFALKLLLGEMAEGLLLSGQRAVPERARQSGFTFLYTRLDDALAAIFSGAS